MIKNKKLSDIAIKPTDSASDINIKQLAEETYHAIYQNYRDIAKNRDIVFTPNVIVPVYKDSAIKTEDGNYIPKQFEDCLDDLQDYFHVVKIKNKFYSKHSDKVVNSVENNWILREDAFKTVRGFFYETDEKLIYLERNGLYIEKERAVFVEDMQRYVDKRQAYPYKDEEGTVQGFYEYKQMMPHRDPDRMFHFNETEFPEEFEERRVGIEFEFGNSGRLCREVLSSPDLRKIWQNVRDGSLDPINQGSEFVSIPLRLKELWRVEELLNLAKDMGADCHERCGFHVHISAQDFNFIDTTSLITLCSNIESKMFSMMPKHRRYNNYCRKLDERFNGFLEVESRKDKKKVGHKLYDGMNAKFEKRHEQSKYVDANDQRGPRYYWINIDRFYHKRNQPKQKTVEFRHHHATFDSESFINFIYLCYYITLFAKRHSRKTCKTATLKDIIKIAKPHEQKFLTEYLNNQ